MYFSKVGPYKLAEEVESQNNVELCESLELLEITAPIIPDEALQIVDVLLRPENEKTALHKRNSRGWLQQHESIRTF